MDQLRLEAFLRVTRIERGLRRLLEALLPEAVGLRWVDALPPDIKEKVVVESLDFLDFGDLKKCIASKWFYLESFHSMVKTREHLLFHLEELEPIRNALAHSRDVTPRDLALVSATYHLLEPLIAPYWRREEPHAEGRHPVAVLLDVRASLDRNDPLGPELLADVGTALGDDPQAAEAIASYERVRLRPGRERALLQEVRTAALRAIDPILSKYTLSD